MAVVLDALMIPALIAGSPTLLPIKKGAYVHHVHTQLLDTLPTPCGRREAAQWQHHLLFHRRLERLQILQKTPFTQRHYSL